MSKYLFQVSYTAESLQALLKSGSTARRENSRKIIEGMGGKQEAYYLAFLARPISISLPIYRIVKLLRRLRSTRRPPAPSMSRRQCS